MILFLQRQYVFIMMMVIIFLTFVHQQSIEAFQLRYKHSNSPTWIRLHSASAMQCGFRRASNIFLQGFTGRKLNAKGENEDDKSNFAADSDDNNARNSSSNRNVEDVIDVEVAGGGSSAADDRSGTVTSMTGSINDDFAARNNQLNPEKLKTLRKEASMLIDKAKEELKSKVDYAKTLKEVPDERNRFFSDVWRTLRLLFRSAMQNGQQGEVGKRGEIFFVAQLLLAQFILFGVPLFIVKLIQFSGWLYFFSGAAFIMNSLWELKENLSPFPAPSAENRLVTSGVYQYVRHPMYGGLLMMCFGVSITSYDFDRIFLSIVLGFLLNYKADYEESLLKDIHKEVYQEYAKDKKKLIPFVL